MPGPQFDGIGAFRAHYPDGDSEDLRLNGRAVVEAERRWPGVATDGSDRYRMQEGVHFMCWISLGRPLGDFEKWLDTGVTLEVLDEAEVPTKPVVGVA